MVKRIILIYTFILFPFVISGQVTIGTGKPANLGSLLDLKQSNSIGANSTKGLLLPRVNLKDINYLYPMFAEGYDKNAEDFAHTGLTVYNVNNCFSEGVGPYAWDGEKWNLLIQQENPEVLTFEDQDGNPFLARRFGDAGIWMTQNLAAKTFDPIRDKQGETIYSNSFVIRYPNKDPQLTADHPWMGVFYDFKTATNNRSREDINDPNIDIQGICPHGWHLPSTQEWYNLETEIIKNTDQYTTLDYKYIDNGVVQLPLSVDVNQQYGDNFRPGLIDPCPMPGWNNTINGVSLKSTQGGFAVRMVGVMKDTNSNGVYDVPDEYGTKAGFWVARSSYVNQGKNRVFLNTSIHNNNGPNARYYSVRCKKNE